MTRALLIGLAVVAAAGVVWWFVVRDEGNPLPPVESSGETDDTGAAPEPPPPDATKQDVLPDEEPLPDGAVRVFGTVVTPDGAPAAGAAIDLVIDEASSLDATSDAGGAFSIVVAEEAMGDRYSASVRVRDGAGHGLLKSFGLRNSPDWPGSKEIGPEIDLGTLTLLAGSSLDVRTILPPGARSPVTVRFLQLGAWSSGGLYLKTQAGENGIATAEDLPPGTWRILASAEGAGRGQAFVKLPQETPEVVEIELGEEHIGVLTVLDAETELSVEGATVTVREFVQTPTGNFDQEFIPEPAVTRTDERGRIEFRGLAANSRITIRVNAEGYPKALSGGSAAAQASLGRGTDEVVVKLARARTISWPVVAGPECAVPEDGTPIRLKTAPGSGQTTVPEGGVMEGGRLIVEGFGAGSPYALAVAPDGSMARLWAKADAVEGPEIHFVPARSIEVAITYPDGSPAPGFFITVVGQGNNPLTAPIETDAEGMARIADLFGGQHSLVEVKVSDRSSRWGGAKIATVNLEEGDASVTGTVRHAMPVTLRITIDGEAWIPDSTEEAPTGSVQVQFGGAWPSDAEVDAERGEISFDWRPGPGMSEIRYSITRAGYLPAYGKIPVPEPPAPIDLDVALFKGGSILVKGKLPGDGRHRINLDKWDTEKNEWVRHHIQMMRMGGYARFDANQEVVLQPLATGRYRVLDVSNFVASEAVEVVAGAPPPSVVLDASEAGFVRGTVEAPEGVELKGLRVLVIGGPDFGDPFRGTGLGGGSAPKGLWTQTNDKGEFWLRIPGNEEITLYAEGTGLEPAADGGRVTLTKPREGVVLRLARGSAARIRFAKPLTTFLNPGRPRPVRVEFYRGEVDGTPAKSVDGQLDGEGAELVFSVEPGKWTVWIDAGPFVPVVLRDIAFEKGENDLGVAEVFEGSKVTLEVRLAAGEAMPRMYLWAHHLGKPAYQRNANSGKRTTFSVSGLGAGRFRLTAGSHMGMGQRISEEIEVDGVGEVKRVMDLTK